MPSKSKHAAGVLRLPTLHASAFYVHLSPSPSGPLRVLLSHVADLGTCPT